MFAHPTDMAGLNVVVEIGADILAHAALLSGDWDSDKASVFAARGSGLTPALRLFELFSHPSTPVDLAVWQAAVLDEAGSDIRFGADAGFPPEYGPQGEYALMNRFMDWREILASMTTIPYRRLGEAGTLGELAPGEAADIVLLSGDPALDYRNPGAVARVLKQGRPVSGPE